MVEGPGCKIKGEKMKSRLKGKVVRGVSGNVVEKENKAIEKKTDAVNRYNEFIGRKLEDVQTLGKELFMYFGDKCFRVHFLMAGSFRVNDQVIDHDVSNKANTESMVLELDEDKVAFYKCSVDIRISADCHAKCDRLHSLDICSSTFNHKRAVQTFMEQENRLVCDVLLDQVILPGVGNIIKNEALFDSGIRPSSRVKELSEPLVSHLIRMTRDFSMIFYKCRKTGKPLRPYEKVYNRGMCKQCEGKITRTRMGEDSDRMTYYCPQCQSNNPNDTRILPTKNSLLGWVTSGRDQAPAMDMTEWTCTVCTLINAGTAKACAICEGKRPKVEPKAIQVPIIKPVQRVESSSSTSSRRTSNRTVKTAKRKADSILTSPAKKLRSDRPGQGGTNSSKLVFLANSLFNVNHTGQANGRSSSVEDLSDNDSDIEELGSTEQLPVKTTLVTGRAVAQVSTRTSQGSSSVYMNAQVSTRTSQGSSSVYMNSRTHNSDSMNTVLRQNIRGSNSSIQSSASQKSASSNGSSVSSSVGVKSGVSGSQTSLFGYDFQGSSASTVIAKDDAKGSNSSLNSRATLTSVGSNTRTVNTTMKSSVKGSDSSLNSRRNLSTQGSSSSSFNSRHPTQQNPGIYSKIPLCPKHNKKCALLEVRKEGVNLGRMFFCCALPRGKQCFIFKWADEDFPICDGHGKKCVLRTVLKEGPNNGRKFFACSVDRRKQCKFFQWADEYSE